MFALKNIPVMDLGKWSSSIRDNLGKREVDPHYLGDFYKLLSDVQDGVNERTELIQFHKAILHNKNLFHEDGFKIRLGSNMIYKYSSLRKQLYLSLFAMIGGVYDSAARLCMLALDKAGGIKSDCQIHKFFFGKDNITSGYQDVLGPLKRDYGYFLGVVIFLRNLFIHRGESSLDGKPLFMSNSCSDFDFLNPDVLSEIERSANDRYEIKKFHPNELPLTEFKNRYFIDLVDTYLLYSDHAVGLLINSLLGKHVGII